MGRKRFARVGFLPPLPGLGWVWRPNPRFHRGLLSVAPPALLFADAGAQIFFQTGEGAGKDGVVL